MSYFEEYFNVNRVRTLRGYAAPLALRAFDEQNWLCDDAAADVIERRFKTLRHHPLITPAMAAELNLLDHRKYAAGTLGSDPAGLYQPPA